MVFFGFVLGFVFAAVVVVVVFDSVLLLLLLLSLSLEYIGVSE